MTAGVVLPAPQLDWRAMRRLVLAIGFSVAVQSARSVKCERHIGDFNSAFASELDIDRLDCRLSEAATVWLWAVPPYADIELHLPR